MQKCYERFVVPLGFTARAHVEVLDLGGAEVNGSYRSVFPAPPFHYATADISDGAGVDLILRDPYHIPLPDASIDIVVSGQMLEHCELFWLAFAEMVRVLKPDGLLILIAPSAGPIHRYPVDCYRFYPDAYAALARYAGCRLYQVWLDERGPWRDLVGVFGKRELRLADDRPMPGRRAPPVPPATPGSAEEERIAGRLDYLAMLSRIHRQLRPRRYLEIGVRHGRSLALADCPAIGVDPAPEIQLDLGPGVRLCETTSDRFFDEPPRELTEAPPDLVFIDGMHWMEFALRDFMHVERLASPTTLVVIDDIYPGHARQARRTRETQVWTGDVWKLFVCLAEVRPEFLLLPLDTRPTGLLLVAGLDPDNRVLWDSYNPIVRRFRDELVPVPPKEVLARRDARDPEAELVSRLLNRLRELRDQAASVATVRQALREWCSAKHPAAT